MLKLALKWQLSEGRDPAALSGVLREVRRERYLGAQETPALVRALSARTSRRRWPC